MGARKAVFNLPWTAKRASTSKLHRNTVRKVDGLWCHRARHTRHFNASGRRPPAFSGSASPVAAGVRMMWNLSSIRKN